VTRWAAVHRGPLTELSLQAAYGGDARFRVSRVEQYAAGERVHGLSRAGTIFVLSGLASFDSIQSAIIPGGCFVSFPAGAYTLTNPGPDPVRVVFVWELPPSFRSGGHS
jgi:hypothetical protein